ncbi:hypothetical protein Hdeb2414_s0446g00895291 [Helianthus debilis subsp. tardiflorus]
MIKLGGRNLQEIFLKFHAFFYRSEITKTVPAVSSMYCVHPQPLFNNNTNILSSVLYIKTYSAL